MAGVRVGVQNLYYAICNSDTEAGVSYETPVRIPGVMKIGIDPSSSVEVLYADDGPSEAASTVGAIKISLQVKDLDLDTLTALLGHSMSGGVMTEGVDDSPPYVALLWKSQKSNGSYRYIKLLKGKFAVPKDDYESKGEKLTYQTPTIEGTFLRRDYDGGYKKTGDEDHGDWAPATGTDWFTSVEALPTALTLTTVPADTATAVAVGSNITFTYNNAINASQVTSNHFYLFKAADGTLVPASLSIDTAHKVVTLDPTSNLTAATPYIAIASGLVKDVYGQKLAAGTTVVNFTTA